MLLLKVFNEILQCFRFKNFRKLLCSRASRLNTVDEDEFRTSKLATCCQPKTWTPTRRWYKILVAARLLKQRMSSQCVGLKYFCSYQHISTVSTSGPREREASSIQERQCSRRSRRDGRRSSSNRLKRL